MSEKQQALAELGLDPDQRRLETFHRMVYGKEREYRLRRATIGTGDELANIADCTESFAEQIVDYAEEFLEEHQYDRIDDLILTGGGCMIPKIREVIYRRLKPVYHVRKAHMYIEPDQRDQKPIEFHGLDLKLARGATALGGASVYFDFA